VVQKFDNTVSRFSHSARRAKSSADILPVIRAFAALQILAVSGGKYFNSGCPRRIRNSSADKADSRFSTRVGTFQTFARLIASATLRILPSSTFTAKYRLSHDR
ncbi:MAG TPA: hypothetical protein VK308_08955, partial [Pyrinomonadaceae bacterium]|nr:hypothetical protein [Pyrinomonadaceae bacterium]